MDGEEIIGCGSSTQTNDDSNQHMQDNQQTSTNQSQEQDQQTHKEGEEAVGRKRKLTSPAWQHFTKMVVNGEQKAECNYCKTKLGVKRTNGTNHLHSHMNKCIKQKNKDIRQQVLSTGQTNTSGPSDISCYNFDGDKSRKDLVEMVVVHEYPLSIVEHHRFRKFVRGLQPFFKKTMRILEKNASRVAITMGMWTSSNQKKGLMAITTHFIDDNWEMQSRIMRFIYVPCPHTAEVLANVLYESLCDWNIDRKMRCCAHILNLIFQDGLSIIANGIERIRDSVSFLTATPKRVEKFEAASRHLAISSSKKLCLDCKTRWNSTYLMLSIAGIYKDVFKRLKQRETQYNSLPSEKEGVS
ncbi:zinc finger BED domain-containing protein RICESLEEPER 1-like [Bidens hawaiensis]|uniref:zinc finger BED domain-containing protein RICESLEEPER 1-like n=1 Tax=Bidens hawaiensis TaxID=980011 RepID=UPI00404B7DE9